jgi:hypothetical protein
MANTYYPRIIRKLVVGFGNLFDDITLVRYNPDQTEAERFIVTIAYATKEKYVQRLEGDANLDKKVQMTLPRMSFEMNGLTYDASRKQNTNIKNFSNASGTVKSQYNPVPYNFDFSLYVYVRNVEDGTQIIEHILPYFTPDYTIKLNLIPEMGIIKEVPVVLNSTSYEVEYEGVIFGASSGPVGLIKTSITNILNDISVNDNVVLNTANTGVGTYQVGEFVYQGYSMGTAVATGKVVSWTNNKLTLTNINGNFVSTQPIVGQTTNANYAFTSFQLAPLNYSQIVITPNPSTANANSAYTYTVNVAETPLISNTYPKV